MKLSVPFIPDETYTDFLKINMRHIESVYFSFHQGPVLDARMRFHHTPLMELAKMIEQLGPAKKYLLLNSRFIDPKFFLDKSFLNKTMDRMEMLSKESGLSGFVFSDAYLLKALASTGRGIISSLEAVPGVNCMLDSADKAAAFLELIEAEGFKIPGKLIPDRSLNRDPDALSKMVRKIKSIYKNIKIELLANEGCIYHCPFKLAHDAQISFSNMGHTPDTTYAMNHHLGCHSYFFNTPWRFLTSPFIRPEDTDAYSGLADTLKICGRTLGRKFLIQCIRAYIEKKFTGNLLDLMDAANWLGDLYDIDNQKIDKTFFKHVSNCTKGCKECSICSEFFLKAAKKKSIGLKSYKDYL